jgi:tetratricopeptide (TPR) repeat protein
MRVNVQLIDAESGNHLWADRFDKPVADLFDVQDEIVARLANSLDTRIVSAEARRAEGTRNPSSLDLYFQGRTWLNKGWLVQSQTCAAGFFQRALDIDPHNVEALIGSAVVHVAMIVNHYAYDGPVRLKAAQAAVSKALSLAPDHALAHACFGLVQTAMGRPIEGISECERALALDRNLAAAHGEIGRAKILAGRAEETETHVYEALRLSPRDTFVFSWLASAGWANLFLGRDEQAVVWLRQSIEALRGYWSTHLFLAAALANLGRHDEAHAELQAGLALFPNATVSRFRTNLLSDNPAYLAQRERYFVGLSKAGLPEE